MSTVYIYALSDPRDGRVRYIGRTVNPLARRLREHLYAAKRGKLKDTRKAAWFDELSHCGLRPDINLIKTSGIHEFQADERRLIAEYRQKTPDLLNVKPGGDGGLGGHFVNWTPELDAMLGVVSDSVLASKMGITRKSVSYRREKLGIPASFDRTNNKPPPAMGGHNRIDVAPSVIKLLGTMPDYQLATSAGCSKYKIARLRNSLGIKSYAEITGNNGKIKKGDPHRRWARND